GGQDLPGERPRRPDHLARASETADELLVEAHEIALARSVLTQVAKKRAKPRLGGGQERLALARDRRPDELFQQLKDAHVGMAADLVEREARHRRQEIEWLDARQRLGEEGTGEIEAMTHSMLLPISNQRRPQGADRPPA